MNSNPLIKFFWISKHKQKEINRKIREDMDQEIKRNAKHPWTRTGVNLLITLYGNLMSKFVYLLKVDLFIFVYFQAKELKTF